MLRKLYNACWYLVGGLLLIAALAVTLIRLLLPGVNQYREDIEQLASHYSDYPISIETVSASWQGWSPQLNLSGITLYAPDHSRRLASFEHAQVRIATLASLWQQQPVLESLIISGAQLKLVYADDGAIQFTDQRFELPTNGNGQSEFSAWLFQQPLISLRNVHLTWIDEHNQQPPLQLTQTEVNLRTWQGRIQIDGHADLPSHYGKSISFALDINGDPSSSQWSGTVYLEAHNIKPAAWPQYVRWQDVSLRAGEADLRLWSRWQDARLTRAAGRLQLQDALIRGHGHSNLVREMNADFRYQRSGDTNWQVGARISQLLTWNGTWPVTDLRINAHIGNQTASIDSFYISQLRIEDVSGLIGINNRLDSMLDNGHGELQGNIQQLHFQRNSAGGWELSGRLHDVGIIDVQNQSRIDGLTADFALNEQRGRLQFHTKALDIVDPKLFVAPINGISVTGALDWFTQDNQTLLLQTDQLLIDTRPQQLILRGEAVWNRNDKPRVDIQANLSGGDVIRLKRFVPTAAKDKLKNWIREAILDGQVEQVSMVLRGDLDDFPFKKDQGLFRIEAGFSNVDMKYDEEWPPVLQMSGDLTVEQSRFSSRLSEASVYSARLHNVEATIPDLFVEDHHLLIDGKADGKMADATIFLQNSPLAEHAAIRRLLELELDGDLALTMNMDITLFPEGEDQVAGDIQLLNNGITSPRLNIALEQVSGHILFKDEQISSRELQAIYHQQPVALDISSTGGAEDAIQFSMQGQASAAFIQKLLAEKLEDAPLDAAVLGERLQGSSPWKVDIVATGNGNVAETIRISSSLEGMAIDLPPPLGKTAESRQPLQLTFDFENSQPTATPFLLEYADALSARYTGGGLSIHLGAGQPAPITADTISIKGHTPLLDVGAWVAFLQAETYFDHPSTAPPFTKTIDLDIETQSLKFYEQQFHDVHIAAHNRDDQWLLQFTGRDLAGTINLPVNPQAKTITANLDRLHLQEAEGSGADNNPHRFDPSGFPALAIHVSDFAYGAAKLGQLDLTATPAEDGLTINEVSFNKPGLSIQGQGHWQHRGGVISSRFNFDLNAQRIADMLSTFGYTDQMIDGGKTALHVDAIWPGSPMDFSLARMDGLLELHIEEGRLLEIDPKASRLFGLLSIQTLPRRLSLDFSDLFKKGLAFDRIDGSFTLKNGIAYTSDLTMEGPAAKIKVTGHTNLVEQTYDQIVTVIPQISDSLPVASALFGPIGIGVGAVLFLTGQVFEAIPNQIDRLLGYQYTITGSWGNPTIEPVENNQPADSVLSTTTPLSPQSEKNEARRSASEEEQPADSESGE